MNIDLPTERAVVLFSGGFDSTLVLADLANSVSGTDTIYAVSIEHNLTGMQKLRREYESQLLILRELRKRFPKVKIEHEIIKVESNWISGDASSSTGLAQPILWLCNLIPLLQNNDKLFLGYIKDDQAMLQIKNIDRLIESACDIQDGKHISIQYPLKYFSKAEILRRILQDYPYLFDLCTSCESTWYAGDEVCGNCMPCIHLKEALLLVSLDSNAYAEKAKEMLCNKFGLKVTITTADKATQQLDINVESSESDSDTLVLGGDAVYEVKSCVS